MKRGVTLIELLVAMAITTLVGYIAFDLVRDEQGNYTKTRTKVRLQADAREAVRILEEDFANLGFSQGLAWGDTVPVGSNLRRTCLSGTTTLLRADQRLFVFDDGGNGSDTIEGRFFRVSPTDGVQCDSSAIRVRYFVRGTQLIRQFWSAGDSVNMRNEAVVLDDVLTFQAQAAIDTVLTNQLPSIRPINHPMEDAKLVSFVPGDLTPTDTAAHGTTGDTLVEWRGWGTSPRTLESNPVKTFMPNATYHVSCLIEPNAAFRTAFQSGTDTGFLQVYVTTKGGFADTVNVRLPSHSGIPFWVSWGFQTGNITTGSDIYFGVRAELELVDTAARLRVGSVHVKRVAGDPVLDTLADKPQWLWRDAVKTSPVDDSLFRLRTEGLKVWLVTRSRRGNREGSQQTFAGIGNWSRNGNTPTDPNSYAIFERILPVVNHGF